MDDDKMRQTLKKNRENALKELQVALDKITVKDIIELNPFEIAFLKARLSYLKPEEKIKFKSILEVKKKSDK